MIITILYKLLQRVIAMATKPIYKIVVKLQFIGNGVSYSSFRISGVPYVMVARGARGMRIGKNFAMNNGIKGNPIGCYERCTFFVDRDAELMIGDNVGISQSALISYCSIIIGNNVKIGGGYIYLYH